MIVAYALLVVIWGTTWSVIQIGLEKTPPMGGVAIRFLLAGVLLWAIARARGVPLGQQKYEKSLWWINATLAFAVSYGIVYWAEQWIPSGLVSVLFATYRCSSLCSRSSRSRVSGSRVGRGSVWCSPSPALP